MTEKIEEDVIQEAVEDDDEPERCDPCEKIRGIKSREFWTDPDKLLGLVGMILGIIGTVTLTVSVLRGIPSFVDSEGVPLYLCAAVPRVNGRWVPNPAHTSGWSPVLPCLNQTHAVDVSPAFNASRYEECYPIETRVREVGSKSPALSVVTVLVSVDLAGFVLLILGYLALALPFIVCPCLCCCIRRDCVSKRVRRCSNRVEGCQWWFDIVTWPVILMLTIAAFVLSYTLSPNGLHVSHVVEYDNPGLHISNHTVEVANPCTIKLDDCHVQYSFVAAVNCTKGDSMCTPVLRRDLNASSCERDHKYYRQVRSELRSTFETAWMLAISTLGLVVSIAQKMRRGVVRAKRRKAAAKAIEEGVTSAAETVVTPLVGAIPEPVAMTDR